MALSPSTSFAEFYWLSTGKSGAPFGHNFWPLFVSEKSKTFLIFSTISEAAETVKPSLGLLYGLPNIFAKGLYRQIESSLHNQMHND